MIIRKDDILKSKHLLRKVDNEGRVVLPAGMRKNYNIKTGDFLEVFVDGENLVLKKFNSGCFFCGEMSDLIHLEKFDVCKACGKKIIGKE